MLAHRNSRVPHRLGVLRAAAWAVGISLACLAPSLADREWPDGPSLYFRGNNEVTNFLSNNVTYFSEGQGGYSAGQNAPPETIRV